MTPETPEQDKQAVKVWYDNTDSPEVMNITIPLKHFAENEIGTVLCKGFFDDIKDLALKVIRDLRLQKAQKGVILPPSAKAPTNKFEVH